MATVLPRPPVPHAVVPGKDPTLQDVMHLLDEVSRWGAELVRSLEVLQAELEQPASTGWTTSNVTETRSLNVSTATLADVANTLATLIEDLKTHGDLEN